MNLVVAASAGIVLAASAGLRAFMPLLGIGLAARLLDWPVAPSLAWMASDAGLVTLGVATVLELAADKVPVLDHVLDLVHTVVGPLAGALVMFGVLGDLPPVVATLLGLALGAPVAGGVHAIAATTRVKSTVVSGGTLNPVVSVAEDGISIGAILMALLVPVFAAFLAAVVIAAIARLVIRRSNRRSRSGMPP